MRRQRQLTQSEKWDLGLLLALFIVGLLVLTVLWRTRALPNLLAMTFGTSSSQIHADDEANQPSFKSMPMPVFIPAAPQPARVLPSTIASQVIQAVQHPLLAPAPDIRIFKGEQFKYVKTLHMRVTAYSPDSRCCWPYDGTTTASGASVKTNSGKLVAADTSVIPFHDLVSIPGYNGAQAVPVLDRGGAIKGNRLDVLLPTYEQAQAWGSRMIDVKIYAPAE